MAFIFNVQFSSLHENMSLIIRNIFFSCPKLWIHPTESSKPLTELRSIQVIQKLQSVKYFDNRNIDDAETYQYSDKNNSACSENSEASSNAFQMCQPHASQAVTKLDHTNECSGNLKKIMTLESEVNWLSRRLRTVELLGVKYRSLVSSSNGGNGVITILS